MFIGMYLLMIIAGVYVDSCNVFSPSQAVHVPHIRDWVSSLSEHRAHKYIQMCIYILYIPIRISLNYFPRG